MKLALGLVGVLVLLFVAACIPHNLRIARARAARRRATPETRARALELLAEAGRSAPATTLLVPADPPVPSLVAGRGLSKVGGRALGRGEVLPAGAAGSDGHAFLLQVELRDPSLPPAWRDRLVTVHLVNWRPEVRSFAPEEIDGLRPLGRPEDPPAERMLLHVPIPHGDAGAEERDGEPPPYDPDRLLDAVPALEPLLAGHGVRPRDLLAMLFQREDGWYSIEAPEVAFQGGRPEFIQSDDVPACARCRAPMRFLFQFGEIVPGLELADAGVGYVFGCAAHPEEAEARIDGH